jgi:hypothetical protein
VKPKPNEIRLHTYGMLFFTRCHFFYQDTIPTGLVFAEQNAIHFSDEAGKSLPENTGALVKKLQLRKFHD